jgi:hypothetical protein
MHCEFDWDKKAATSRWYDLGELVNKDGDHLYPDRLLESEVDKYFHNKENDHEDGGRVNNDGEANEANSHENGGEANIRAGHVGHRAHLRLVLFGANDSVQNA